jgi:hypothetical protein
VPTHLLQNINQQKGAYAPKKKEKRDLKYTMSIQQVYEPPVSKFSYDALNQRQTKFEFRRLRHRGAALLECIQLVAGLYVDGRSIELLYRMVGLNKLRIHSKSILNSLR